MGLIEKEKSLLFYGVNKGYGFWSCGSMNCKQKGSRFTIWIQSNNQLTLAKLSTPMMCSETWCSYSWSFQEFASLAPSSISKAVSKELYAIDCIFLRCKTTFILTKLWISLETNFYFQTRRDRVDQMDRCLPEEDSGKIPVRGNASKVISWCTLFLL